MGNKLTKQEVEVADSAIRMHRERALRELLNFLHHLHIVYPPNQRRHFRWELEQIDIDRPIARYVTEEIPRFDGFLKILEKFPWEITRVDLQPIVDALNLPVTEILQLNIDRTAYKRNADKLRFPGRPSYIPKCDFPREAAQALLNYLNWSQLIGVAHTTCELESCGALMTEGRGGKRFCSPNCAQRFYYQQRKQAKSKKPAR